MADERDYVDYLLELLEDFPNVTAKRMFGGYGLFRDGLMFGLVADSTLYLKVDKENKPDFEARDLGPFMYDGKSGKPISMSYHRAPEEVLDNADDMFEWAESAYAAALRSKKPSSKKPKKSKPKKKEK